MQEKEFDKLIDGKPALMADMKDLHIPKKGSLSSKKELRKEIKRVEKPIPPAIREQIDLFIEKEKRKSGWTRRAIRRAVMRKFGIKVV